jgi:hypothetical protein
MKNGTKKIFLVLATVLALSAIGATQVREILKIFGVTAVVRQFGGEINNAINRLANHRDTEDAATKVVPILSVGIGRSSAIGAAQVTGPRHLVRQVEAVAQPEADLFGREVRIRALIPVSDTNVTRGISRVPGVGVSGIVDLKL